LAIEPMVNMGIEDIKILEDNWTTVTLDYQPSAHFEHSIVLTDTGYEILTKLGGDQYV
jgi:methionyl aminopeptidase